MTEFTDICLRAADRDTLAAALVAQGIDIEGDAGVLQGDGWLVDYGFQTVETPAVVDDSTAPPPVIVAPAVYHGGYVANLRLWGAGAAGIAAALADLTITPSEQQRQFAS